MYMAKHAMLYKHKVHDGEAIIFYIDVRAGGKGYEEFVTRAQTEDEVIYIRGKVSKIYQQGDKLIVLGADTLAGRQIEVEADMVVLSTAMIPNESVKDLIPKLRIQADPYGFFAEAHPKLRPVESISAGFFVAGATQAPKDIPETVAQASGAASKVTDLFATGELLHEPVVAVVDEDACCGCGVCVDTCPYGARELSVQGDKRVVKVNEVLCEGCGACVAACPSGATGQKNFEDYQVYRMIDAALVSGD
jgi:heterodisulfide reductase subunit A